MQKKRAKKSKQAPPLQVAKPATIEELAIEARLRLDRVNVIVRELTRLSVHAEVVRVAEGPFGLKMTRYL